MCGANTRVVEQASGSGWSPAWPSFLEGLAVGMEILQSHIQGLILQKFWQERPHL